MIGRTRADSRVLNMAASVSQRSAIESSGKLEDSDFLAKEMDSEAHNKVRPKSKSLREKAAQISANLAKTRSKDKVAKDAGVPSDSNEVSAVAPISRTTRKQSQQNGGAQPGSSGEIPGGEDPAKQASEGKSTSGSKSQTKKGKKSDSSLNADVVGDILEAQDRTFNPNRERSPPPKRTREKSPDPPGKQDISAELLGVLKNLNSSLNNNATNMQKGFEGLASSMNNNFSKLSQKLVNESSDSDQDESEGESSSDDDNPPSVRSVEDHPLSDEESVNSGEVVPPGLEPKTPKTPVNSGQTPGDSKSSSPVFKAPTTSTPSDQEQAGASKNSFFAKKRAEIAAIKTQETRLTKTWQSFWRTSFGVPISCQRKPSLTT